MGNFLTDYELKLVMDAEVLLTKNRIIQKVYELFGQLSEEYKSVIKTTPFINENEISPKISRGENYRGLPYVILDYPRQFGKVDVFAIRSFFWWGNFFSITLQLSGDYQRRYCAAIEKAIDNDLFDHWYIGCAATAWEHHFDEDNYTLVNRSEHARLAQLPFIKLAKKIPLDKWDEVEFFLGGNFTLLIKALGF